MPSPGPAAVFVTDFGLATAGAALGRSQAGTKITRRGELLGTPQYMSPEQAAGGPAGGSSPPAPASDVWALGCVLFELLAGRPAFAGETSAAIVAHVMAGPLPRLPAGLGGLPPDVPALVGACLTRDPARRPSTAAALRDECAALLRGDRTQASRRAGRRRAAGVSAFVVVGAAVAGVALWAARRPAPPPAVPAAPSRADGLAARAAALRRTDPRGAAALLAEALALAPDHADWHVARGLALWACEAPAAARAEWDAVPAAAPERGAACLYRALSAMFELGVARPTADLAAARAAGGGVGALAEAAEHCADKRWAAARAALSRCSGWEARLLRGYVEMTDPAGDAALAVDTLTQALAEGLPFAWGYTVLAEAHIAMGNLDGALAAVERALAIEPGFVGALNARGLVHLQRGEWSAAGDDFTAAIAANPNHAEFWGNRAAAAYRRGDLPAAEADVQQALALDPGRLTVLPLRGALRVARGDLAGALHDFDAALAVDPNLREARLGRANAHLAAHDARAALPDLDAVLARTPDYEPARVTRSDARLEVGDTAGALADAEAALARNPECVPALVNRALLRRRAGDRAGALADLELVVRLDPESPQGWGNLGQLRVAAGDDAGAIAALERFLALAPQHPAAARFQQLIERARRRLAGSR